MGGRYLLDTNAIIALLAKDPATHEHIVSAAEVFIPSIALGEMYFGAHKSHRVEENLARIEEFAAGNMVLPCDMDTAKRYGEIKNRLKIKGQPIPENDIWIAALAQQYSLILVSNDAHFTLIDNLQHESWS